MPTIGATSVLVETYYGGTGFTTTATLTPTVDTVYLATVVQDQDDTSPAPPLPTLAGCGLNWVQVATIAKSDGQIPPRWERVTVFRACKSSGLSAGHLTVSHTYDDGGHVLLVDQLSNVDTSGTDGANAIAQAVSNGIAAGTSLTVTLSSYSALNAAYGAFGIDSNSVTPTPEAGYTSLGAALINQASGLTEFKTGTDTSVSVSWTGTRVAAGIALELVRSPVFGIAALTGTGDLSAAGIRTLLGTATLAGAGTLTADGLRSMLGIAALTGSGTLTADGRILHVRLAAEAAFGYDPWDTPTWTDISDNLAAITWQYGRQNELNQMETGTATVSIGDENSDWDSANPDSIYAPNVKLGLPIRIYLDAGGDPLYIFYGFLVDSDRTYRSTDQMTMRELGLVDGMEFLARAGIANESWVSELSHVRIGHILDAANVPAGATFREIGTGSITVAAASFDADDPTKALTHALQVADTEQGLFYWAPSGVYRFVGCEELNSDATWNMPIASFSDLPRKPTEG